jgi:hypothetical protein
MSRLPGGYSGNHERQACNPADIMMDDFLGSCEFFDNCMAPLDK